VNALIANCSDGYNLAVHRLGAWLRGQGATVEIFEGVRPGDLDLAWADRVYLSVVFSWDLPAATALARRAQELQTAVEIGGPAAEANAGWVEHQIGVAPWRGPHPCAEARVEAPQMTWTSRGCPNRCPFCLVPRVEGDLVELDEWPLSAVVMDNNFLACSEAHQERVIRRLAEAGLWEVDFNQGLDARRYAPAFRQMLDRHDVRPRVWRFAYDRPGDWPAVEAAVRDLHGAGVRWQDIQVYLLYNHRETPEEAVERARQVVRDRESPLACPWPMAYAPLNWMDPAEEYVSPGWTLQAVRDFRRYWSRPQLWRTCTWLEYDRSYIRSGEKRGYPEDWEAIATRIKDAAGWRCEHCGHRHDPENGYALTVHHLDDDPSNNVPKNLVALCQRCHLRWGNAWRPGQIVMAFARPAWMAERGLGLGPTGGRPGGGRGPDERE
jgi:hypothetical protein